MSDRDFEKQVQQEMDGFKLRPSASVWVEVEKNIRRDKRRRRAIIWIPLGLLFLLAGGYLIYTTTDNKSLTAQQPSVLTGNELSGNATTASTTDQQNNKPNSSNKTAIVENSNRDNTGTRNNPDQPAVHRQNTAVDNEVQELPGNDNKQPSAAVTASGNNNKSGLSNKTPGVKQAPRKMNRATQQPLLEPTAGSSGKQKKVSEDKIIEGNTAEQAERVMLVENTEGSKVDEKNSNPENITAGVKTVEPAIKDSTQNDSAVAALPAIAIQETITPDSAATAVTAKKPAQTSKWQWGIQANVGIANFSDGNLFDFSGSTRVMDLAFSAPVYNNQFNNSRAPVDPSPIYAGRAFGIGGFVQRNLSKRWAVSAGLHYNYYSVRTFVGERVDSLQTVNIGSNNSTFTDQYYRGSNDQSYTFRYHFIEIPVAVHYRIINSRTFPVTWDAGFAVSRLVGTNALHFDGIGGVYYKNNDLFRKMQYRVTTGISFGILQRSKHPLLVGPQVNYFVSDLINEAVSQDKRLWSAGIQAKILLKK